ncbi:hypothetical protein [Sebaldella sp. S0638]|uniref:hypothetical protein n=1 Tax=Sebaldella sp. S0638 TaxID=2957809 RepID=UPI00209E44C4|nr:hypothetical protein [Sebaldella sp. S0638]MCP1225331.1 hypothetical protein [Sebaldella sp. S0638]
MKKIIILFLTFISFITNTAQMYEYNKGLREGTGGKFRQHQARTKRQEQALAKTNKQIEKKTYEVQEIEELLFQVEQYKIENNIW